MHHYFIQKLPCVRFLKFIKFSSFIQHPFSIYNHHFWSNFFSSYLSEFKYCETIKCLLLNDSCKGVPLITILCGGYWANLLKVMYIGRSETRIGTQVCLSTKPMLFQFCCWIMWNINRIHMFFILVGALLTNGSLQIFLKRSSMKIYYQITNKYQVM